MSKSNRNKRNNAAVQKRNADPNYQREKREKRFLKEVERRARQEEYLNMLIYGVAYR